MSFKVETIPNFEKEAKRLKRKFPSLKKELDKLIDALAEQPVTGTPLGFDCYKIRIKIASKGKGKRGGARLITCIKYLRNTVYLISIFDKSEKENILDKKLKELIEQFK